MLIYIQALLRSDYDSLRNKLSIVAIIWLLVALAIIIDLISGVRKAKERGEMRTSVGFRQTVSKVVQYYSFLIFAFLFDGLLMLILSVFDLDEIRILPFASIVSCCFLVFIEWKSFMEKANDKHKKQFKKSMYDLVTLLNNRDDLLQGLTEVLEKQTKETTTKESNNESNR